MGEVVFNYEGIITTIQCNSNDKMKDIISKFLLKINKSENNNDLYYIYNGEKINLELTSKEQSNEIDKDRKKMNILVIKNIDNIKENKKMVSKDIICPECKENTLLNINNFKINLSGCKNKHDVNDILLSNFEETQKIELNTIVCDICKMNNKGNTHNNEFYACNTCNKNICPLCKTIHDKNHFIINYDDKNYVCKKHNETFIKYCITCHENICIICQNEHFSHNNYDLSTILFNKDELLNLLTNLKDSIDKFKYKINIIKEIFDKMIKLLDIYYSANYKIFNNYNINKRNYYQLQNLNYLKNNNEILIIKLNELFTKDKISEIFDFSFNNFYNDKGEKYLGEMKNGLKVGKGILYYDKDNKNKREKYEGDFKNDKPDGKGILFWVDGSRYEGEWKNDKKEGKGKIIYSNGAWYEGDWKNGKREGQGIYYWNNGDKYEGNWKNNLREGKGIYYYKDGKIENGFWKKDKYLGK